MNSVAAASRPVYRLQGRGGRSCCVELEACLSVCRSCLDCETSKVQRRGLARPRPPPRRGADAVACAREKRGRARVRSIVTSSKERVLGTWRLTGGGAGRAGPRAGVEAPVVPCWWTGVSAGAAYTLYTRTYIKAVSGTYTLASSVAPPFSPLSVSLSKLACLGTLSLPTLIAVAVFPFPPRPRLRCRPRLLRRGCRAWCGWRRAHRGGRPGACSHGLMASV